MSLVGGLSFLGSRVWRLRVVDGHGPCSPDRVPQTLWRGKVKDVQKSRVVGSTFESMLYEWMTDG